MDKRITVAIEVTPETRHNFYAGVSGDLCYGGVFLVSDRPPAPGETVAVVITLPDGGRIRAQGCVRWTRTLDLATSDCPAGSGIAWQAIDRKSMQAVRRFLARAERTERASQVAARKAA